ncbi:MAG: 30S ribosomal protein S8 [Candidatus Taylorbacteria bacterium RIFCSPLOWO2_12_FULL_47_20]|uniref:Small ribosomal subunit protein uS8 n=2 Tax=Candidatus Tayloriibacteriota TaxID=1817919 RepID=A0A1G2P532_9BACT|nr:MAG: 30S ribosomal protein S8 [Candidatus Taylorbacteria bacterium RIFCSPLOWO2_02_FULL_46_40]OHA43477.1 MAG: 30S ribosomal protein S8 [Candidatus Taylorbacteria bacterium RIFCSPLOWO2_12_FULL_47_20]
MVKDRIADLITQITNAGATGKTLIVFPYSKFHLSVAELLLKEGFVEAVAKRGRKTSSKLIEISLKYEGGRPRVSQAQRVSKFSRRVYYSYKDLRPVKNGFGITVLSTSRGIMSDKEAIKNKVGGEALFKIW